ncbi:MAG TPA: extensin family protein [Kofleriaceae bacterium]|nr:extensin family protein [Kofleriaceae bacterium]
MKSRELGGIALSVFLMSGVVCGAAACNGDITGGRGDDGGDDDGGAVTLAFVTPSAGATFERDALEPELGWRAATVDVEMALSDSGDSTATIELAVGDVALGAIDASGRGSAVLIESGAVTLTATARDAGGAALATATVDVMVGDPTIATCREWLTKYGITYTAGPMNPGVPDPVTVTTPINGMPFRYSGNANVRATFFMDCSLARSLVLAAPHMRSRGVVEVTDIGVYNYRCIGGVGTPPDCPNGISQHAYAKGIDLAGFKDTAGTFYSVNDDWVIDPSTEKTCEAATSNEKDAFLHDLICALKGDKVWNIVLTPNYNADHRNHFHVDMTTGSDFIRKPTHGGDQPTGVPLDGHYDIDRGPDLH